MHRQAAAPRVTWILLLLPLAARCGDDLPKPYALDKLRILAVQADPPWPGPGETTTLRPLIHVPGSAAPTLSWSWCPITLGADADFACAVPEADLRQIVAALGGAEPPPYNLGSGITANLDNRFDGGLMRNLCVGIAQQGYRFVDPEKCTQTFTVYVQLTITHDGQTARAIKEVTLRLDAAVAGHANPVVQGMRAGPEGTADAALWTLAELPNDSEGAYVQKQIYDLRADFDESEAEAYVGEDAFGQPQSRQEALVLSWFIDAGSLDSARTSFIPGDVGLDVAAHNQWTLPSLREASTALLHLVIADNRGGQSWISRRIALRENADGGSP